MQDYNFTCLALITKMFAENKNITDSLKRRFLSSDADKDDLFFDLIANKRFIQDISNCIYYQYLDIISLSNIYLTAAFVYSRLADDNVKEITKLLKKHYSRYYNNYNKSMYFDDYITKFDYKDINVFIEGFAVFQFMNSIINGNNKRVECREGNISKMLIFIREYFDYMQNAKKNKINKADRNILKAVSNFAGGLLSKTLDSNTKFWHKNAVVEFLSDFSIEHGMLLNEIYGCKYSNLHKESLDVFLFYTLSYIASEMKDDASQKDIFYVVSESISHLANAYGRLMVMYGDARKFAKKLFAENEKMVKIIHNSDAYMEEEIKKATENLQSKIDFQQEQLNEKQKEIDRLNRQLAEKDAVQISLPTEPESAEDFPLVLPATGEDIVINLGTEKEFFSDEFKGFILSALRNELKRIEGPGNNLRRIDALRSILAANASSFDPEKSAALIKAALKQDKIVRNWVKTEGKKHNKLNYFGDNRYQVTMAKTSSDFRSNENLASTMINVAY